MAENNTQATGASVDEFMAADEQPVRRLDRLRLLEMMTSITGEKPEMWGRASWASDGTTTSTGQPEGDAAAVGFSPRKTRLSLYGLTYGPEAEQLLPRLGKHKAGAGCLSVNKLEDVDEAVLAELIRAGYRHVTTVLHSP